MYALFEMAISLFMILLWAIELFYRLMSRNLFFILLSFTLLLLWVDELFPIKRDLRVPFNTRLFLTAGIVLSQHILRFFI